MRALNDEARARLVLAPEELEELVLTEATGDLSYRLPAVGYPRFPAARPGGGLAYIAITAAPSPWQVVLVVLDSSLELLDVVPGAAVFGRPVWSTDGQRLLYVRGDSGEAEVVEWCYEDGSEKARLSTKGLRSAAWGPGEQLLFSVGGDVFLESERDPIASIAASNPLLAYGSDDLYVTIDQLVVSATGTIAAVERWYQQGRSPSDRVIILRPGEAVENVGRGRAPCWLNGGRLLYTTGRGEVYLRDSRLIRLAEIKSHSSCLLMTAA